MNKICGIYKITSPSNRVYIGQSVNIIRRWKDYKKLNCKVQTKLYRSFIKYGINTHVFEILEECTIDELNIKERFHQEYYNVLSKSGLNLKYQGSDEKRAVYSEEARLKISIASINRWRNFKKVINIETNTIYNSAMEAFNSQSIVKKVVNFKRILKGSIINKTPFRYLDKDGNIINNKQRLVHSQYRKVINKITGEIFKSLKEGWKSQTKVKTYGGFKSMLCGGITNNSDFKYYLE